MKLTEIVRKLFQRKHATSPTGGGHEEPLPLRIEGIADAPLTPEPDEAELAAQAVLEMMCDGRGKREDGRWKMEDGRGKREDGRGKREEGRGKREEGRWKPSTTKHHPSSITHQTSEYYQDLATRIRQAREAARQRTMRFLAYCEQTLAQHDVPVTGPNSLQLIERELYKRIDIIEREGGELKRRWQHCLADVTVRLMKAE